MYLFFISQLSENWWSNKNYIKILNTVGPFLVEYLSFCVANLLQKGEIKGKTTCFFFYNVKTTCHVLSWRGPFVLSAP